MITIDPNQITEDTVYHEFGHILVNTPKVEVRKYVQQVIKTDPVLARAVKAQYPELEGLALGRRFLLQPSDLRVQSWSARIHLSCSVWSIRYSELSVSCSGYSPAQQLCSLSRCLGRDSSKRLGGKFNSKLQNSRDLRDELTTVTEDHLSH